MPTTHTAYGSAVGVITTAANSLANGASLLSAAIDNTTALNLYVDAFVKINTTSTRASGARVDVYVLGSPDGGTTYEDLIIGSQQQVGSIGFDAATAARLGRAPDCPIPPSFYKLAYVNGLGVAFAATLNTMNAYPHSAQST